MVGKLKSLYEKTLDSVDLSKDIGDVLANESKYGWNDDVSSSYFSYTKLVYNLSREISDCSKSVYSIYSSIDFEYPKKSRESVTRLESELNSI